MPKTFSHSRLNLLNKYSASSFDNNIVDGFYMVPSGFYASPKTRSVSSEYWYLLHLTKLSIESFQTTRFRSCFQQSISGFFITALRECRHFGL